ncbi:DUF1989 domain-containing protein [Pelagicoccus albus]|uniref:Urea carboxylase-associated family protein n=1 Tax=Pelagicoccus albus TaxID=415222 RepID=A0A7X1E9W9_9BACT|nr:urea carboxylase-associated family protein [Pelagicoccus albus]MBC2607879.1 urea carboxylase-associated family protein [Pelagicoccus albus]
MDGYKKIVEIIVPASHGKAVKVAAGDRLEVIDLEGKQVGDLMAWVSGSEEEYFSPAHTLTQNWSVALRVGSVLATNKRRILFRVLEDDVGIHDILVPCCDHEAYVTRYGIHDHRSCLENIKESLSELGEACVARAEMAVNLFMNNRIESDGKIVYEAPEHGPGSRILLSCELDALVALSACPQDQTPTNGWECTAMMLRVWRPE